MTGPRSKRIIAAALLGWKAKKLLYAAVLCWVVGAIIVLVVLSAPMPMTLAGPLIGGAVGLMIFGVFFLILAIAVFYSIPRQLDEAHERLLS